MALWIESSLRISDIFMPPAANETSALALRRAMSSHIGCPDGANAACGNVSPKASPTTCELAAVPKNSLAITSPFNDITMIDLVITYTFLNLPGNPAITIEDRVVGLADVAIPANATNSVTFSPISFDDLLINYPAIQGKTANLTMVFRAVTVEGAQIFDTFYEQLFIESCGSGT